MRASLLLFAAACAQAPQVQDNPDAPLEPTPWSYEPQSPRDPTLSEATIAEAITTWVPVLRSFELAPLFTLYESVDAQGDPMCPTRTAYEAPDTEMPSSYHTWSADCTTEQGATFFGYAEDVRQTTLDEEGWLIDSRYVYGAAQASTAEGHTLGIDGYFTLVEATKSTEVEGVLYDEVQLQKGLFGGVTWNGPGLEGTWLGRGLEVAGSAYTYEGGGSRFLSVEGTVSGMAGPVLALATQGFGLANWRGPCAAEPTGTISVRDVDGGWYDVVFDAPSFEEEEPDTSTCDGCGSLWFEGARVGEVCVDLSSMLAWEGRPW